MDRNRKKKRAAVLVLLFVLLILAGGSVMFWNGRNKKTFKKLDGAVPNPMMGYAPCAWYEEVADDINLLYVDITWRELEPEEGVFDWESIAKENQFARWKEEGKHLVLRFVCDVPGEETHKDIPDWLYEKTGGAGNWYDMEYGCGFSPDYENTLFIEYHRKAVEEMGRYFGTDGFVGYIELGSLGHWGEWHVNYRAGIKRLPSSEVREAYVTPWLEAFPDTQLLMRRPFAEAKSYGLGVYNDMTGQYEGTEEWLEWIKNGGKYEQTREPDAIVPMEGFWKTAPAGGEFTSSLSMKYLLESNLKQTTELVKESHMTFLGPKIADSDYPEGYEEILKNLGYRIRISDAKLQKEEGQTQLTLTWVNDGRAPMYMDWQAKVYVLGKEGAAAETVPVDIKLNELLPGEKIVTKTSLETEKITGPGRGGMCVAVGIEDSMTGRPSVTFAQKGKQEAGRLIVFE